MYRRFAFEGNVHDELDCVPLAVRRKLDLAALKISLAGWQALSRAERLALCHLPVDRADELSVYREVLTSFAERAEVPLKPLTGVDRDEAWGALRVPEGLAARVEALGVALTATRWAALDEEERYCVVKLADPKRDPAKLKLLVAELGL